jgi:hypothetical protein
VGPFHVLPREPVRAVQDKDCGKGPVPGGRATVARITPRFGTATLSQVTGNVSVPAGASVAVTIGGFCNPPDIVCVDLCQAGKTNVPAVVTTAAKCILSMRTFTALRPVCASGGQEKLITHDLGISWRPITSNSSPANAPRTSQIGATPRKLAAALCAVSRRRARDFHSSRSRTPSGHRARRRERVSLARGLDRRALLV